MQFDLIASFTPVPSLRPYYNLGCLFDMFTGRYYTGKYGESILNAGLGPLTGVVGIGNNFKSTIMLFMFLTVLSRMEGSRGNGYDCEVNIVLNALKRFISRIPEFKGEDLFASKRWLITDKTMYWGNEWYELLKEYLKTKVAAAKKITVKTPFLSTDGQDLLEMLLPTLTYLDSLTEFTTQDVVKIMDNNELGDSGGNAMHMRQGLAKMRLIQELPREIALANNPVLMTAQIGKKIQMDQYAAPTQRLKYLRNNDEIKGVTEKFTFATHQCYQCLNTQPLQKADTRTPEYPRDPGDDLSGDTDLSVVTINILRNKNGPSGLTFQIIVSQTDGVLPSLTEFHYIKANDRFGLDGTLQNYCLDLLPNVKLSRTSVRGKIDNNDRLRRAINITSEMCQMQTLWHDMSPEYKCTPKQLYQDLIARGYNWDQLLDTRGWWTYDNDKHPVNFLSTMDLLKMRLGLYHPYWMPPVPGQNITMTSH